MRPDRLAPFVAQNVVIVQHGEDFGVFLVVLDHSPDLVLRVDAVNTRRIDYVINMDRDTSEVEALSLPSGEITCSQSGKSRSIWWICCFNDE